MEKSNADIGGGKVIQNLKNSIVILFVIIGLYYVIRSYSLGYPLLSCWFVNAPYDDTELKCLAISEYGRGRSSIEVEYLDNLHIYTVEDSKHNLTFAYRIGAQKMIAKDEEKSNYNIMDIEYFLGRKHVREFQYQNWTELRIENRTIRRITPVVRSVVFHRGNGLGCMGDIAVIINPETGTVYGRFETDIICAD